MKTMKRVAALLLTLCLLIGLPMAVQAADEAPEEELKLLYATKVPDIMANRSTDKSAYKNERSIALYFNKIVDWDATKVGVRILGCDKDGNVVTFGSNEDASASALLNNTHYNLKNPIVVSYADSNHRFSCFGDAENPIDHFRLVIFDTESVDGKIDGITVDGEAIATKVTVTSASWENNGSEYSQEHDAILIDVEEKEDVLLVNSVEIGVTTVHVGFSEAVTINTADCIVKYNPRLYVTKRVFNSGGQCYEYSYETKDVTMLTAAPSVVTLDEDGKGLTAAFTSTDINSLFDSLYKKRANDPNTDYCLTFSFNEIGDKQDAANGEVGGNFFVDAIRGKDTNKPLYVNAYGKENAFCESVATPTKLELTGDYTLKLTMSQEVQLKDDYEITANGNPVEIEAVDDRKDDDYKAASVWTLTTENPLSGDVTVNLNGAFYDVAATEISTAIATVGNEKFNSLDDAMKKSVDSGMEIILLDDVVVTDKVFMLDAGAALDLSGYTLTANHVMAFGQITDSTDGDGKLVVDKNNGRISLLPNNTAMPLYDAENECYRFFNYILENLGAKTNKDENHIDLLDTQVRFGVKLFFNEMKAYELLAANTKNENALTLHLAIGEKSDYYIVFKQKIMEKLLTSVKDTDGSSTKWNARDEKAITLTVSGLGILQDTTVIEATPAFYAAGGVVDNHCEDMTYTYSPATGAEG